MNIDNIDRAIKLRDAINGSRRKIELLQRLDLQSRFNLEISGKTKGDRKDLEVDISFLSHDIMIHLIQSAINHMNGRLIEYEAEIRSL